MRDPADKLNPLAAAVFKAMRNEARKNMDTVSLLEEFNSMLKETGLDAGSVVTKIFMQAAYIHGAGMMAAYAYGLTDAVGSSLQTALDEGISVDPEAMIFETYQLLKEVEASALEILTKTVRQMEELDDGTEEG